MNTIYLIGLAVAIGTLLAAIAACAPIPQTINNRPQRHDRRR
jgi:hypothetical protein